MSRRRVLFIDDDPRILEGIARLLRPKRMLVEVFTAVGGAEALALLAREPVDVVISDMRMPQMDGAQLLGEVRRLYPQVVRIILSGQSDRETILRAVGPAHQFLSKPCDPEILTATVLRACALRDLLAEPELQRAVASLSGLPCAPAALAALRSGLTETISPVQAADLVATDIGLSAKVMQLTATSFFGTPRGILPPREAASCLGPDVLRALAQGDLAFAPGTDDAALSAASLQARRCGQAAREVALHVDPTLCHQAEVAGLLCGCGSLLAVDGASGCDAAAFLVGLWGMPDAVVEAVQRSYAPASRPGQHDRLVAVVHAAVAAVEGVPAETGFLAAQGIGEDHLAAAGARARAG